MPPGLYRLAVIKAAVFHRAAVEAHAGGAGGEGLSQPGKPWDVSIRAPVRGRLLLCDGGIDMEQVSIRAPVRGRPPRHGFPAMTREFRSAPP